MPYEVAIQAEFCAAHALRFRGQTEPIHGHNFRVEVTLGARDLDPDGLVCDFHEAERALLAVIEPFRNRDLNSTPPFDRENPSAERIARHIADRMEAWAGAARERGLRTIAVRVTEAPGCAALYRTPHPHDQPDRAQTMERLDA